MAMAMSQAWGKKIGSWADESEAADVDSGAAAVAPPEDGFPSLSQATKPSNSKKKSKGQTLSWAEFSTGKYIGPGAKRSSAASSGIFMSNNRLTSEELMFLPTGPKERSAEELNEQRLGGGFRGYGGNFRNDRNDRDSNNSNMRFSREREPPMSMPPPASRADESSDWKTARSEFSRGGNEFGGRGGSEFPGSSDRRFIGDRDAPSKADEADSWTSGKKLDRRFEPDDQRYDNSRSYSENTWGGRGRRTDSDRSRESERWSEGGLDRKFEEPPQRRRLNLQPRSVPVDSASPGQNASSRPSSSHSSRPGTPADVQAQADAAKPRSNPFGSAKPREMVLEERGQDWKKIDTELEHKRYETEEEKMLKHEINSLTNLDNGTAEEVKLQIEQKQQELEQLIKDLDSKARVSGDPLRRRPPSSHENWNNRPPSSHENWINNNSSSSRPPSSHENRRPPSSHENRSSSRAEVWRRPRTPSMQENEGGWRRDRPRTASGEFGGGFNRPRTPSEEFWRRDNSDRSAFNHNMMFNNSNNEPADMWSRPRTPSVHEDEFFGGHNTNRRFNNNDFHHKPSARW